MARTTSKIFEGVETFDEFKETLFQYLLDYPHMNYMHEETLATAIIGFKDMDEECQKKVLKFARHVDRKLSQAGTARGNMFHKLPAVMAGCVYLRYFSEQVKDLSLNELVALSRFSIVEPISFYETSVDYLGHDLLTAVTSKHFDYMFQTTFLDYAESKIRAGESKEDVAAYVRDIPIEQLKEESFEYERKVLQEVGQYI